MAEGFKAVANRRRFLSGSLAAVLVGARTANGASTTIGPIRTVEGYEQAMALAKMRNRYALVDVAAQWCEFCHTIESEILIDPQIRDLMADMALLKVDVTDWNADSIALVRYLQVHGPPTVFLVDLNAGEELPGSRSLGVFDVRHLAARIRSATGA